MTTQQMLLLATCIYLVLLAATTYFTRATKRRVLGALTGGLAVAVIGVGIEILFQTLGFWYYPSADQPYGPPMMYPLIVVMWAVLALLGWRVMRRFGWRGQAAFLTAVTVVGTLRDYLIAGQALGFIVLAPGPLTVLVDATCWAGTTALAQAMMQLVSGPARADRLASRRWKAA
jgi:hypothetical protein